MPQHYPATEMTRQLGDRFDFTSQERAREGLPARPEPESRGIDYFSGYADQLFGDPQGLSPEEQGRMHELSVQAERLQPTDRFAAGSPRDPYNPFSIDTRGAMTGISNLILSLEDRRRFDQLHGSPERQARLRSRADERRERGQERTERAGERLEDPSLIDRVRGGIGMRRGERDLRRAGELEERADRFGGISEELSGLRGRAETAAQTQEERREFLTGNVQSEIDSERLMRNEIPMTEYKHNLDVAMEDVKQEHRVTLDNAKAEVAKEIARIRNNPDDPDNQRKMVSAISQHVDALNPFTNAWKSRLLSVQKNIDELRSQRRLNDHQQGALDQFIKEEEKLMKNIANAAIQEAELWRQSGMALDVEVENEEEETEAQPGPLQQMIRSGEFRPTPTGSESIPSYEDLINIQ